MEKVKLPREIAADIERFRNIKCENVEIIYAFASGKDASNRRFADFAADNFDTLLSALVNGYEVEETPEDKVREQYKTPRHFLNKDEDTEADIYRKGIKFALDTLGITIKGVNDHGNS